MKAHWPLQFILAFVLSANVLAETGRSLKDKIHYQVDLEVLEEVKKDYIRNKDKDDLIRLWYQIIDLNKDNIPEIIYFSSGSCGNKGCTGSVYIKKNKHYCYSGAIHESDIERVDIMHLDCFSTTHDRRLVK